MDFKGQKVGGLWRPVATDQTDSYPYKKECWILESQQGARSKAGSELPGLTFMDPIEFHRLSLNLINSVDLAGFWG